MMSEPRLAQALGLRECVMIAVGGMMGSAVFGISGMTYAMAGPAVLISWLLGGLIMLIYSFNIAELATTFPRAGGIYVYPSETLGKTKAQKVFLGWIAAWSWLVCVVIGAGFSAIFIAGYLGAVFPGLQQYTVPVGVLWVILCWYLNIIGISQLGKINTVLTILLLLLCLGYICLGIGDINFSNFSPFFNTGSMGSRGILTAIPMAMLGYGSVIAIASIAEEIRDPQKIIPKAIGISQFIVVCFYFVMLFVTFGNLPWQELAPNTPQYFAPIEFAASKFAPGSILPVLISLAAVLAITTTMLVMIMDAGRILLALGRDGFLPKAFSSISDKYKTPSFSLTIVAAIAAIIAAFPAFAQQIVGTGSFTMAIMVILEVLSLMALKRNPVKTEGQFQLRLGSALPVLAIIAVIITVSQLDTASITMSAWLYLIAVIWFAIRYFSNKESFISA
ncbi:MAG: APC family permease [Tepidanaerobacteraceae bacterium]|jgi:APA family basic amino acid/polyamine antiporter